MHPKPYLVESHAAGVTAWSTERLNFEPKDWRADLKAELATATKGLGARKGELLHARYASAVTTACDTENVLIYNVGPGCFAAVARDGLRIERALSLPPNPPKLDGPPLHHHSYGYVSARAGFTHWRRGPTLAAWENVPCSRPTSETKVAEVWHTFRGRELPLTRALSDPSAVFGLSLAVHVPATAGGFRPASCVKSLFDGTLVAWHAHDGSNGADVAKRIAAQLRETDAIEVNDLL